jgi:hypothetical protein
MTELHIWNLHILEKREKWTDLDPELGDGDGSHIRAWTEWTLELIPLKRGAVDFDVVGAVPHPGPGDKAFTDYC